MLFIGVVTADFFFEMTQNLFVLKISSEVLSNLLGGQKQGIFRSAFVQPAVMKTSGVYFGPNWLCSVSILDRKGSLNVDSASSNLHQLKLV